MKKIFLMGAMMAFTTLAFAQAKIEFEEVKHDFGDIPEGPKSSYTFKFKNTGNEPLVLQNVRASCGCTVPEWSKEPIAPGASSQVKAVYNTKGRPGSFSKTITITSNASEPRMRVYISGQVIPANGAKPAVPDEKGTGVLQNGPKMRIEGRVHNFGKMEVNQQLEKTFEVENTGKSDLVVRSVYSRCNCTSYTMSPSVIKPGAKGKLNITYRPKKSGAKEESVYISINAPYSDDNRVMFKSTVVSSLQDQSVIKQQGSFFGK